MSDFKTRIKEMREGNSEKALNHSQFAGLFDKSEGAVRAWEAGRTKPDADSLIEIAKHFNVSVDYLLGLTDAKSGEDVKVMDETGLSQGAIDTLRKIKDSPENAVMNYLLENDEFLWLMELFSNHKEWLNKRYDSDEPFEKIEKNNSRYENPYMSIQGEAEARLFVMEQAFKKLADQYRDKCINEIVDKLNK